MKKTLFLAALMAAAAWGTTHAQTLVADFRFKADNVMTDLCKPARVCDTMYNAKTNNYNSNTYPMKGSWAGQYMGCTWTCNQTDKTKYPNEVDRSIKGGFYTLYDADDEIGSALASAEGFTIEALFRPDKLRGFNGSATTSNLKIIGSQEAGGFCFAHESNVTPSGSGGFRFEYVTEGNTWNGLYAHQSLHQGHFYHVVMSVDRSAGKIYMFVNGEQWGQANIKGTGYTFPNNGTTRREKNMILCLGGDAPGADEITQFQQANATSFVFTKIYQGPTTLAQVKANLYTDAVKELTEPQKHDMLLDVVYGEGGTATDASPLATLTKNGTLTTQYIDAQKRYAYYCNNYAKTTGWNNFVARDYVNDAAFTSQVGDEFSLEFYGKYDTGIMDLASTTRVIAAISGFQSGGFGLEFAAANSATRPLKAYFNTNSYGWNPNKGSSRVGATNALDASNQLDGDWHHYVATFNRLTGSYVSKIYRDGTLVGTCDTLTNTTEGPEFPVGEWQWIGIGGDTRNSARANRAKYADSQWPGHISIARIWGKALTDDDVALLAKQAVNPETTVTIGSTGFATVRLPYIAKVPTGLTAYAVTEQTGTTATLTQVAEADECLPYGAPVILQGDPGTYTFEVFNTGSPVTIATNLLEGSLAGKDVKANEVYVLADNGSGKAVLRKTDALTIPANKAWLPATAGGASAKTFVTGGGLDAISAVKAAGQDAKAYYNLQGQPVSQPQRGIYIQGGKKVFVK
ncbi:MAG: hypothetical protein ILA34_01845 [Bacteroidaceae bacterium]|nr:hypothetical protein [Bacteroidaceae bacterium]